MRVDVFDLIIGTIIIVIIIVVSCLLIITHYNHAEQCETLGLKVAYGHIIPQERENVVCYTGERIWTGEGWYEVKCPISLIEQDLC